MREAHYTSAIAYMQIDSDYKMYVDDVNHVQILAYSTNRFGDKLFLFKKNTSSGSSAILSDGKPMYILVDITYEELAINSREYLWVLESDMKPMQGNAIFKGKLTNY